MNVTEAFCWITVRIRCICGVDFTMPGDGMIHTCPTCAAPYRLAAVLEVDPVTESEDAA